MSRIGRRAFTTGGLSLAACGGAPLGDAPLEKSAPTDEGDAPTLATPSADSARDGARFSPVVGLSGMTRVVWSWTTSAQLDELERGVPLLSRDTSPELGDGLLFTVLRQRAEGIVARVAARLRVGRFGWFNPWAASRGFEVGETYGTELLRIVVAPDALFMVLASSWSRSEPVVFTDVAGNPVGAEVADAAPERVAGIYFTHDAPYARGCRGTGSGGGASPYREVYIGDEAHVASFSARSALVAEDLARADADLAALSRRKYSDGGDFCAWSSSVVDEAWARPPTTLVGRYLASLAFPTAAYVPTRDNLDAIRATLAAVPILRPGIERARPRK